jgi:hypothetical protein
MPRQRGRLLTVAGGLLLTVSAVVLGLSLGPSTAAPQPPAAAAGSLADAGGAIAPLARSEPVGLSLPSSEVRTQVGNLGLNPDGSIEVPQPGPGYDAAAWYRYSPTPGEMGPAIIEGHLDTSRGPSVFYRLGALLPGAEIDVARADGSLAVFRVTAVRTYAKADFPTAAVYGDLDHPGLRLITCGGDIDPVTRHYEGDTVVFADLIDPADVPSASPSPESTRSDS